MAIISLVTAFFFSLAAVITGHIALKQIKETGEQGKGLAVAGLILGYLGIIVAIGYFVFLFVVIGIASTGGGGSHY